MGNMTSEERLKELALFSLEESNEIHDNSIQYVKCSFSGQSILQKPLERWQEVLSLKGNKGRSDWVLGKSFSI